MGSARKFDCCSRLVSRLAIRAVRIDGTHVVFYMSRFLVKIFTDGREEFRFGEPVRGPCRNRNKATADLVFTLCTRFEYAFAGVDAVLNTLVITGFKVQSVVIY